MNITPVTLVGQSVRLEPLSRAHLDELIRAGSDPAIFRWFVEQLRSSADMRTFIEKALAAQAQGQALPFATVDARDGRWASVKHCLRDGCSYWVPNSAAIEGAVTAASSQRSS